MNPIEIDAHLRIRQMSLNLSSPSHIPLNVRIAEFREDPQNMDVMKVFVDDILEKAQIEVDAQLGQKNKVFFYRNAFPFKQLNNHLLVILFILQTELKKNGKGKAWTLKYSVNVKFCFSRAFEPLSFIGTFRWRKLLVKKWFLYCFWMKYDDESEKNQAIITITIGCINRKTWYNSI